MKLGIMQPYFFPYLGYFDLINQADRWIVFDTPQYIRHGWVNRNRILHPSEGWQYVTVPLTKHSRDATIDTITVASHINWQDRILGQLAHYKKKAPNYNPTIELVRDALTTETAYLSRLNTAILSSVCKCLNISFEPVYFSEMDLELGLVEGPGDWALRICESVGATEYINPPGGAAIFDEQAFDNLGIRLTIQDYAHFTYSCRRWEFVPGLSVIDCLMWNEPEAITDYLNSFRTGAQNNMMISSEPVGSV